MGSEKTGKSIQIKEECIRALKEGRLPPWKVEEETVRLGIVPPDNYKLAAEIRRAFIQSETGENFHHIGLPEKPYKQFFHCRKDGLTFELDAGDEHHLCSFCGSRMEHLERHAPLVANYVGGCEGYYSYAGRVRVQAGLEKTFTNLLVYGTGLGPIGVTRGSFFINKFGGAEVIVSDSGRAARCLCYSFTSEEKRSAAAESIQDFLSELKPAMENVLSEFRGRLGPVEYLPARIEDRFLLYVDFTADFSDFRGHGLISQAVGLAKQRIDAHLQASGIPYEQSVIAQGYDGDLKPSPRNKRGRYVKARIKIPRRDFEDTFHVPAQRFVSFVEIDALGARKLGCPFYSGMGGEIIPAIYKATRVNPHSSLVSSFQTTETRLEGGDLLYEIVLPNLEVGVASTREGLIPPAGRETLRIMGVSTAREFAAAVAVQVLAGEFNLALEITTERLYG